MKIVFIVLAAICSACASMPREDAVSRAVDDPTRLEEHTIRDKNRLPVEVLRFSSIEPGDAVADIFAGGGYYTALLSRLVGEEGVVNAIDPARIFEFFPAAKDTFQKYAAKDPRGNIAYSVQKLDEISINEPLDAIVMALYYHDTVWTGVDRQAMNKAFLAALKSGGVLLVIDHHALPAAPETVAKELHRISDAVVRSEIEAAGFELVAESDTLSHPQDPRDMIIGDKSIRGETDRFIYLFMKP